MKQHVRYVSTLRHNPFITGHSTLTLCIYLDDAGVANQFKLWRQDS